MNINSDSSNPNSPLSSHPSSPNTLSKLASMHNASTSVNQKPTNSPPTQIEHDGMSKLNFTRQRFEESVSKTVHVGAHSAKANAKLINSVFNINDPRIKEDLLKIISSYLNEEGLPLSYMALQDELNTRYQEKQSRISQIRKMKKCILEGEWPEAEKLCLKDSFKNEKSFLYAVYKQIYLEMIEKQEYHKAFTFLTKRLKPLESRVGQPEEFKDLCYLLTCKSVQDTTSFKNWDGAKGSSRELLIEKFSAIFEMEHDHAPRDETVPSSRLIHLLEQALAFQIEFSRYRPIQPPQIDTLLEDYRCFVLPNALMNTLEGHSSEVKCVSFVGEEALTIISGSSDSTAKIWNPETGKCLHTLEGHSSKIWDVSSSSHGQLIATASGDATVRLWGIKHDQQIECVKTLTGHDGDVYSVYFHPDQTHVISAGFDKTVRLFDVNTGTVKKSFLGHNSSVSKVACTPHGNMIVTGSKDGTIKFWDTVSGICIKTITLHLGEVTSIAVNSAGTQLLSSSKDNSNRLWDLRTGKPLKRFKNHQNTSKNFIGCGFGPNESLVVGGSEDGMIYMWDVDTTHVVQKLRGHSAIVYNAVWNQQQSLLASCSADGTVKTWWYNATKPLFYDAPEVL